MNDVTNLTPQQFRRAADLKEQIDALQDQLDQLLGSPAETGASMAAGNGRRRRKLSPQGLANIRAGVRKRQAAAKSAEVKGPVQKPKRKMSAAGKARLSRLAKARWKKARAAGKSRL